MLQLILYNMQELFSSLQWEELFTKDWDTKHFNCWKCHCSTSVSYYNPIYVSYIIILSVWVILQLLYYWTYKIPLKSCHQPLYFIRKTMFFILPSSRNALPLWSRHHTLIFILWVSFLNLNILLQTTGNQVRDVWEVLRIWNLNFWMVSWVAAAVWWRRTLDNPLWSLKIVGSSSKHVLHQELHNISLFF